MPKAFYSLPWGGMGGGGSSREVLFLVQVRNLSHLCIFQRPFQKHKAMQRLMGAGRRTTSSAERNELGTKQKKHSISILI